MRHARVQPVTIPHMAQLTHHPLLRVHDQPQRIVVESIRLHHRGNDVVGPCLELEFSRPGVTRREIGVLFVPMQGALNESGGVRATLGFEFGADLTEGFALGDAREDDIVPVLVSGRAVAMSGRDHVEVDEIGCDLERWQKAAVINSIASEAEAGNQMRGLSSLEFWGG